MKYQKFINEFFRDITSLGGFYLPSLIILFTLFAQEYNLAMKLIFGSILTLLITMFIKYFFYKDRPTKENYSNILEKIDASSFPSLHAARTFFFAFVFSHYYNNALLSTSFLMLAALVSYSRIYLKKHFIVDIVGGIILAGLTFWFSTFF
jgi:undecaprenyl-diphosphatase